MGSEVQILSPGQFFQAVYFPFWTSVYSAASPGFCQTVKVLRNQQRVSQNALALRSLTARYIREGKDFLLKHNRQVVEADFAEVVVLGVSVKICLNLPSPTVFQHSFTVRSSD
jgi:hypothetical protein